jgi:hypothetical protein
MTRKPQPLILFLLALATAFALSACGGQQHYHAIPAPVPASYDNNTCTPQPYVSTAKVSGCRTTTARSAMAT